MAHYKGRGEATWRASEDDLLPDRTGSAQTQHRVEERVPVSASVGQKLEAKLRLRRQDDLAQKVLFEAQAATGAFAEGLVPDKGGRKPRRNFGEIVFQGSRAPRDEHQITAALRRLMNFWLGPCNRFFTKYRRAQGNWIKKLSPECPRKLIKALRKHVQDRHALTSLAIVGGCAFFLRRQRDLHLMRGRTALRQLAWYKALFAASRLRFAMAAVPQYHEAQAQRSLLRRSASRAGTETQTSLGSRRTRAQSGSGQDPDSSDEEDSSPVEEVRRLVRLFAKRHARRKSSAARSSVSGSNAGALSAPPTPSQPVRGSTAPATAHWSGAGPASTVSSQASAPAAVVTICGPGSASPQPQAHPQQKADAGAVLLPDGHAIPSRSTPRKAFNTEVSVLEWRLAAQGFTLRPDARSSDGPRRKRAQPPEQQQQSSHQHHEAPEPRPRRPSLLAAQGPAQGPHAMAAKGPKKLRVAKRYLLHFLDPQADLPWLAAMQSLMLVIHGMAQFQNNAERQGFQTRLRGLNQVRNDASKRPGLFQPIEAVLWSHPVILQLASQLQRKLCRGDGALAWKSSVFEGRYELSSERDATGESLYSSARQGGASRQMWRKLAELSGHFMVGTNLFDRSPLAGMPPPPASKKGREGSFRYKPVKTRSLSPSLSPPLPSMGLQRSSGGAPGRAGGGSGGAGTGLASARRTNIARSAREAAAGLAAVLAAGQNFASASDGQSPKPRRPSPPRGHSIVAHSDLTAQRRYGAWMLERCVPSAHSTKAKMLPYFESFVNQHLPPAPDRDTSPEGHHPGPGAAGDPGPGEAAEPRERSGSFLSDAPGGGGSSSGGASSAGDLSSSEDDGVGWGLNSFGYAPESGMVRPSGSKSAQLEELPPIPDGPSTSSSKKAAPKKKNVQRKKAETAPAAPRHQAATAAPAESRRPRAPLGFGPPQTAEDIGRLLQQSDALQTILSVDASTGGNSTTRFSSGWISGTRLEPMSEGEIRRARVVEKFSPAVKHRPHRGGRGAGSLTAR